MKRLRIPPNEGHVVQAGRLTFRWIVHESGHLVVQHASGHGCCLVVETATEFDPSQVEKMIELALDEDWEPTQDGGNHWFRFDPTAWTRLVHVDSRDAEFS